MSAGARAVLLAAAALAAATIALPSAAAARPPQAGSSATPLTALTSAVSPDALVRPASLDVAPPGHRLDGAQALRIAGRLPDVQSQLHGHRGAYGVPFEKGSAFWQVSYYRRGKEIAQVLIADANGHVLEHWTGFKVAWSMARGYPGAFGRHVNALYIWLPLTLLFVLALWDRTRWRSLRNLDLLVLSSFSISLAFFNHGDIYQSVPLAYPPLLYLLVRMLVIGLRRSGARQRPYVMMMPSAWLPIALVFMIGFRVGLNITDSNVIDVGYAGVIGAERIVDGKRLYGNFPHDNQSGDTYGPVAYEAYVPFEQALGWSGRWDDRLPAAHAASIFFDLACIGLLWLIGRRIRGPTFATTLAFAWAAYPFTLYSLESNTNDALVALAVLAALLVASSPPARGALAALAGLTKFAPLALAPLLATHELGGERGWSRRAIAIASFGVAFLAVAAVAFLPIFVHGSLSAFYDHSISFQANRGSPFSIWGLYGGLDWLQTAVQVAAVVLALAVAVVPRRQDLIGLAALAAAIIVALQLGVTHWFYLYIPWFFGLVMIALLGSGVASMPHLTAGQQQAMVVDRRSTSSY
jgi:hypothetical protein